MPFVTSAGENAAAHINGHAHIVEQIRGVLSDLNAYWKLIAGERLALICLEEYVVNRGELSQIVVLRTSDHKQRAMALGKIELHVNHAIGVAVRVRIAEDAIHDAEDGCSGADAES